MDVQERIRQHYGSLTKGQQGLADLIAGSYLDVAFLSSTELAARLNVDPGTITRFAQRLGYEGYPELADGIQELVRRELRDIWEPPGPEPGMADSFRQSMDRGHRNLEEMIVCNPREVIEEVVRILERAPRIFILAPDPAAYHLGWLLKCGLMAAGLPAREVCADPWSMALGLRDVEEGDAVVAIDLLKQGAHVSAGLCQARAKGARAIGLVGTVASPIAEACEMVLVCPAQSAVDFPSLLAMAGVISALVEVLTLREGFRGEASLRHP